MKKNILLLLLFCLSTITKAQISCPSRYFTSQASIDNYTTANPGCTTIVGDITISGSDITNLSGLSGIININGSLEISSNSLLTNLSGLTSLTTVGRSINIHTNPSLISFNGLDNLSYIGGALNIRYNNALQNIFALSKLTTINGVVSSSIFRLMPALSFINNPSLTTLNGLDNLSYLGESSHAGSLLISSNKSLQSIASLSKLTAINGYLNVSSNPLLTSLSGLQNVTKINQSLIIAYNNTLTNLDKLSSLTSIEGTLDISSNPALTSLTGLINLKSLASPITGTNYLNYITIENNNELTSLSGLDNINPSDIVGLRVMSSSALSYCGVKSICRFIENQTDNYFSNNAIGCNSTEEVKATASCISLPVTLINFQGKNTPEGNSLIWQTTSETMNYGFEIERSLNAKTYVKAGFVEGNGDTNETKNYSFTDAITETVAYYRLKQIDFDQKFTYSRIIMIKGNNQETLTKFYPNPVDKQLTIETANKNQPYQIINEQGTILQKASAIPTKPLDTSKLQNGLYFLTIGKESFKVLVIH